MAIYGASNVYYAYGILGSIAMKMTCNEQVCGIFF